MGIFRALIVAAFISARAAGANAIGDAPELAAPGPAAVGLQKRRSYIATKSIRCGRLPTDTLSREIDRCASWCGTP